MLFLREGARAPHTAIRAQRCVTVTDAVMRKLSGVESCEGVDAVAEMAMPPPLQLGEAAEQAGHDSSRIALAAEQAAQDMEARAGPAPQLRRLLVLEGVQLELEHMKDFSLGLLLSCYHPY